MADRRGAGTPINVRYTRHPLAAVASRADRRNTFRATGLPAQFANRTRPQLRLVVTVCGLTGGP